jgi:hypothetical protein
MFFNRRHASGKRKTAEKSGNAKSYNTSTRRNDEIDKSQKAGCIHMANEIEENKFALHMAKYIGITVTVFVNSGGMSGAGFTGILLDSNSIYIKLLIHIGPAPACSLVNSCMYNSPIFGPGFNTHIRNAAQNWRPFIRTVGSIAYIPVDKIAAFVHNAV